MTCLKKISPVTADQYLGRTCFVANNIVIPLVKGSPVVDLTMDGADEGAATLDLIKGGGGALLREKIVAQASRRELIVVDGLERRQEALI